MQTIEDASLIPQKFQDFLACSDFWPLKILHLARNLWSFVAAQDYHIAVRKQNGAFKKISFFKVKFNKQLQQWRSDWIDTWPAWKTPTELHQCSIESKGVKNDFAPVIILRNIKQANDQCLWAQELPHVLLHFVKVVLEALRSEETLASMLQTYQWIFEYFSVHIINQKSHF